MSTIEYGPTASHEIASESKLPATSPVATHPSPGANDAAEAPEADPHTAPDPGDAELLRVQIQTCTRTIEAMQARLAALERQREAAHAGAEIPSGLRRGGGVMTPRREWDASAREATLDGAAAQALATGKRIDVLRYLRLRRSPR